MAENVFMLPGIKPNCQDGQWEKVGAGDYVVETWRSAYSWYRKYKSGWVEQGGRRENITVSTILRTNFLVPIDPNSVTLLTTSQGVGWPATVTTNILNNSFQSYSSWTGIRNFHWFAAGQETPL